MTKKNRFTKGGELTKSAMKEQIERLNQQLIECEDALDQSYKTIKRLLDEKYLGFYVTFMDGGGI